MISKITFATLVTLTASTAFAGGFTAPAVNVEPQAAVAVAAVGDWTGGYLGANLNYGEGKLKAAKDYADALSAFGLGRTLAKPDGASLALRGGYDWQSDRVVFGLGGEYNLAKLKGTFTEYGASPGGTPIAEYGNIDVKSIGTVFARTGYLVNDNFLAYGLVGYTRGKAVISLNGQELKPTLSGWTAGLGGEYRVNANWSAYGEYAYTDFGDVKDTDGNAKAKLSQIKLGVNYRF